MRMCIVHVYGCRTISVASRLHRLLYTGKLRQLCKTAQHVCHIRIWETVEFEQFAQVLDGRRYRLYEMPLLFEISAETVCAKHLQRTEEDEHTQPLHEMTYGRYFRIVLQRLIVFFHKFAAQFVRIACRGLPQERGKVVVIRTAAASLKVDKIGIARNIEHHIAGLEVTVEEAVGRLRRKVLGEKAEIGFEFQLVKIKLGGFQKTILEIVQVEKHAVHVKLRLRIALRKIEAARPANLYVGQLADSTDKQLALMQRIATAGCTASGQSVKQRYGAKIGLKITQFVTAHGKH